MTEVMATTFPAILEFHHPPGRAASRLVACRPGMTGLTGKVEEGARKKTSRLVFALSKDRFWLYVGARSSSLDLFQFGAERCPSGRRSTLGKRVCGNVPWVRIPPSPPFALQYDSRVLRNLGSRTPPGPEGSNGSESLDVPRGCPAIIFFTPGVSRQPRPRGTPC